MSAQAETSASCRYYVRTPSGFLYRPGGDTPEEAWRLFLRSWRNETRESMEANGYGLLCIPRRARPQHPEQEQP